ncbi:hypothetical protein ACFXJ5_01250 [Streptomyces sp. NPDC059373]
MAQENELHDAALDPEQAAHLNRTLRKVVGNSAVGPDLQDVARRLLSGRMELRDVLDSPAGARALGAGLEPVRSKWEKLTAAERQAVRDAEPEQSDAPGKDDDPKPRGRRPRGEAAPSARHTSGGWSAY